jgi:hypothetical protein
MEVSSQRHGQNALPLAKKNDKHAVGIHAVYNGIEEEASEVLHLGHSFIWC